jgi:hypothetical protein
MERNVDANGISSSASYEVRGELEPVGYDQPMPMEDEPMLMGAKSKNKILTINIEQLDYGYVVQVGCQRFAVETHKKVINALNEYMANPDETQRKWFAGEKIGL